MAIWQDWNWVEIGGRAGAILLTWVVVILVNRHGVRRLQRWWVEERGLSEREGRTVGKMVQGAVIIAGVLISLAFANLTSLLYSMLAAAGVVGIAIGFAVKDLASNFISGVFILLDRPFKIDDVIQVGEYIGIVDDISLRTTRIVTFDGPTVVLPNNMVANTAVINFSAADLQRVGFVISISDENDIGKALEVLREMITAEERIHHEKEPLIYVRDVHDGAVDIQLYFYLRVTDMFEVPSDLRRRIVERFQAEGLVLASPLVVNLSPEDVFSQKKA